MISREEAARVLGVDVMASETVVRAARRRLALDSHPDRGGSTAEMSLINAACEILLTTPIESSDSKSEGGTMSVDRPSFVIDRLPAEAFEYLVLAARTLGEIADDEPPYILDVILEQPHSSWCRLEIVPDAGSSTVSIVSDGEINATDLCHMWVRAVNELTIDVER